MPLGHVSLKKLSRANYNRGRLRAGINQRLCCSPSPASWTGSPVWKAQPREHGTCPPEINRRAAGLEPDLDVRVQGQGHCTALSQLGQQRSHSANMPCGIFLKILPLILSRALASNVKIGIKHKGGKGKPFDRQNRRGVPTTRRSLPSPHVTGRPLSLMGLCRSSLCTRSRTEASSAQHTEVCNPPANADPCRRPVWAGAILR